MSKFKMNIPVRFKNWAFWLGLVATILAAMGVSPEMFTSWDMVVEALRNLISNPYQLGCVIVAIIGVFADFTTPGIGDSDRAMRYTSPGKLPEADSSCEDSE